MSLLQLACRVVVHGVIVAVLLACGGGGGGGRPPPVTPTPNRSPVFTSPSVVSVAENTSAVFYTATATDPDNSPLTFSLVGGADRNALRITPAGGLSFVTPPDFEVPADSDRNNTYLVQVGVSDGTATTSLSLTIAVTDVPSAAFRVRRVVAGYTEPVFLAPIPDGSNRVFVVELNGRIQILTPATGATATLPFLDITGQISTDGERGLLGFATAPDFASSGVFYIYVTDPVGTIELRRYRTFANNRDRADPATGDVILRQPHPLSNHNGGWIGFGPDNHLYVAIGDGGAAGDPDNNGQNKNTLLGKMLRIDPSSDGFPADPLRDYAIPSGNPFASAGGAPEVWAFGLRNPFRNSFDPATGNLFIADVGQGAIEEIDLMRPSDGGANFGWSVFEGTQPFKAQPNPGNLIAPVTEYRHGTDVRQGNSVTGGYVYRGPVESLRGLYIFADFIRPNIWSVPASQLVLGSTLSSAEFTVRNGSFAPDVGAFNNIVSFGVDAAGNLYILDFDGEIFVIEAVPTGSANSLAERFRAMRW